MTTVYTVTKECGRCVQLRTLDKAAAVAYAREHSIILDAIACRSEEAEQRALSGDVVMGCACEQEATTA